MLTLLARFLGCVCYFSKAYVEYCKGARMCFEKTKELVNAKLC